VVPISSRAGQDHVLAGSRERALEAAWAQVRLLSRLEHRQANQLLADVLERERAHAMETLAPLRPWPLLPETSFATYTRGPNQVRIRRVLDFIRAGDHVLDIGIGYGYLSTVLIRDTKLDYYCGVDLSQRYLDTARRGIEENGLVSANYELKILNLYDLSPAFLKEHRPNLILLLEVLEHIPNPELAFQTLGAAVEEGTSVLFTVPMLGRLEGVWGHRSLYDEARIVALCHHAGLTMDHVEPVHNTWILALASRSGELKSTQSSPTGSRQEPPIRERLSGRYFFQSVRLGRVNIEAIGSATDISVGSKGVSFRVEGAQGGGITLPVPEPEVFRAEITWEEAENLEAVTVEAAAEGTPRMRWHWPITAKNKPGMAPITHVFRNGRGARHFSPSLSTGPEGVTGLNFRLTARDGASTSATLHRLAFVPQAS
jgi:2-polyprenyl-3-methyl-5-hydroxy-6-metoxy-1,4-benzoquinol methylase